MLAWVVLFVVAPLAAAPRIVHTEESPYTTVLVVDDDGHRLLRFDSLLSLDQSEILLADPRAVPTEYVRVATAGLVVAKDPKRALVIGVGGGTFPMLLRRTAPALHIDAVDIDPVVVDVARRFFGFVPDAHLKVFIEDGAQFLKRNSPERYDLLLIDAYNGEGIPTHLTSVSFFESVLTKTAPGGVAVLNIALDDAEARVLVERFGRVFAGCVVLRGRTLENLVVLGTHAPLPPEPALRAQLKEAGPALSLPFALDHEVASIKPCVSRLRSRGADR